MPRAVLVVSTVLAALMALASLAGLMCLVVAPGLLGAWWLWRGHRWGYVLAVVWNVKGAAYMTALTSATLASWRAGANPDVALAALWATIGGGCALAGMALLRDPVVDS